MNYRHPCQTEMFADPQNLLSFSAGTQMQMKDVYLFVLCLFCVWVVGGCERGGLFLGVLYFRNFVSVCGVSV